MHACVRSSCRQNRKFIAFSPGPHYARACVCVCACVRLEPWQCGINQPTSEMYTQGPRVGASPVWRRHTTLSVVLRPEIDVRRSSAQINRPSTILRHMLCKHRQCPDRPTRPLAVAGLHGVGWVVYTPIMVSTTAVCEQIC